ncbi:MAG: hypothetical protein LQ345_001360 [Seirophora villosa]|nr:MAG: hypothetical protein LQ345_001360 [Seirophora villosa]
MLTAYRAAVPGVALLCSLIAFILALCCLLAGTNPATLPNMELYTLNTSRIASTLIRNMNLSQVDPSFNLSSLLPRTDIDSAFSSAEKNLDSIGDNLGSTLTSLGKNPKAAIDAIKDNVTDSVDEAKKEVSGAISKAQGTVKNATGAIVSAFINETLQSFHVRDFYLGHLLTYCQGNYTAKGKEVLTYCSNGKPNNKYGTASNNKTANGTLAQGPVADDDDPLHFIKNLHLPDPIEYGLKALTLLTKIIAAFYVVALIALFFSLVSAAFTLPACFAPPAVLSGKGGNASMLRWATLAATAGAFFTLLLASTMVHFLVKKLCGLFQDHPGAGVAAYPGKNLQGCSWAAVIFTGIALTLAAVDLAIGAAGNSARNWLVGAGKRKWWGRGKREDKESVYAL